MIDNTQSPGMPEDLMVKAGLPIDAGKGLYETATYTCKHCGRVGIIDVTDRGTNYYCRGCDHIICEYCAAEKKRIGKCVTFEQKVDEYLTSLGD